MKRVAIVAPDFVPSSLPPALRIRFFVRHLPEYGWDPIKVTLELPPTNSPPTRWKAFERYDAGSMKFQLAAVVGRVVEGLPAARTVRSLA